MRACARTHMHTYTHTHTNTHTRTHTHTYTCTHTHRHTHTYTRTHTNTHARTHTRALQVRYLDHMEAKEGRHEARLQSSKLANGVESKAQPGTEATTDDVATVYERCLVPCASYPGACVHACVCVWPPCTSAAWCRAPAIQVRACMRVCVRARVCVWPPCTSAAWCRAPAIQVHACMRACVCVCVWPPCTSAAWCRAPAVLVQAPMPTIRTPHAAARICSCLHWERPSTTLPGHPWPSLCPPFTTLPSTHLLHRHHPTWPSLAIHHPPCRQLPRVRLSLLHARPPSCN